jgi:hypothetical protein
LILETALSFLKLQAKKVRKNMIRKRGFIGFVKLHTTVSAMISVREIRWGFSGSE